MMTEYETTEVLRMIEETRKFMIEQHKLMAEASKFKIDRWLGPVIVIFGGLGSFTASWAVVNALLHVAK
jgi:hypothetical protein